VRDRKWLCFAIIFCFGIMLNFTAEGQRSSSLSLMPTPSHVEQGQGRLKVDSGFTVGLEGYKDARLELARKRFLRTLSRQTGIPYHQEA
jgi:hexosaminidase